MVFFVDNKSNGQQIDEKSYHHKMQLLDSLTFYKMQNYDTLYEISTLDKGLNVPPFQYYRPF